MEHSIVPLGARAAGVRTARSPLVVVAETHAFPARDWAARLVDAHAREWVAVMPSVANANPRGALSWSAFIVDYGRWAPTGTAAEMCGQPPWYHACFKRAALESFGDRLGVLLEPGSGLAQELHSAAIARGSSLGTGSPPQRLTTMGVAPRAISRWPAAGSGEAGAVVACTDSGLISRAPRSFPSSGSGARVLRS